MYRLKRTTSDDTDFRQLVQALDRDLAVRNGDQHAFFDQYNQLDPIRQVVVAYDGDRPVGCGAMKAFDEGSVEIKRMYVLPELRGKGVAVAVLRELELWAGASGYAGCVLETGDKMPEAIGLYRKSGYEQIPNYGPYADVESSLCFRKFL